MTYHRWVRFHEIPDYLLLGWIPRPSLAGTHHGEYSVHMEWICGCKVVEPTRR